MLCQLCDLVRRSGVTLVISRSRTTRWLRWCPTCKLNKQVSIASSYFLYLSDADKHNHLWTFKWLISKITHWMQFITCWWTFQNALCYILTIMLVNPGPKSNASFKKPEATSFNWIDLFPSLIKLFKWCWLLKLMRYTPDLHMWNPLRETCALCDSSSAQRVDGLERCTQTCCGSPETRPLHSVFPWSSSALFWPTPVFSELNCSEASEVNDPIGIYAYVMFWTNQS